MKHFLFSLLLLASLLRAGTAQAQPDAPHPLTTTGGEKQLAALIAKSPVIIEGRAEAGYSFWDAGHQLIFTATPVTVYKVFKGEVSNARVEIITWGGQVGNEATDLSDGGEVKLGLHPTGVFFLAPVPHPNPKTKDPTSQIFRVVDGEQGFFQYESYLKGGANTQSLWQLYPRVETSLYPVINAQVGHPYRVAKAFDAGKFNFYREKDILDSVMYSRQNSRQSPPTLKKNGPQTQTQVAHSPIAAGHWR